MTHIAFFEPRYSSYKPNDWELRGSYKYPSLLGNLGERCRLTIFMRGIPPEDDRYRGQLETSHGVRFRQLDTLDDSSEHGVAALTADFAGAIRDHRPDIVSTLNGRSIGHNFVLAHAARQTGTDYVYRIAGNDIAIQKAMQESARLPFERTARRATMIAQERYAVQSARTVIVMGGTERKRIEPIVSDVSKIAICRRGVDSSHFAPADTLPRQCNNFLFLGRKRAEKGVDLIEAAADIVQGKRPAIRFTIAGGFEERDEKNRRYRGFYGYDDLPELYHEHDALLLPARSEGFPQVVMEAMSCGLPAILSHHLFEQDFGIQDGAELVALDAAEIAAAIMALHDETGKFAAMQGEAVTHAREHFDAATNGKTYHAALLGGSQ